MKEKVAVLVLWIFSVLGIVFLGQIARAALSSRFPGQEDTQGTVTVYLNDGTVWGYYGEVSVTYDRTGCPQVTMKNAWLEGSTHPDFQVDGLKGEGNADA